MVQSSASLQSGFENRCWMKIGGSHEAMVLHRDELRERQTSLTQEYAAVAKARRLSLFNAQILRPAFTGLRTKVMYYPMVTWKM